MLRAPFQPGKHSIFRAKSFIFRNYGIACTAGLLHTYDVHRYAASLPPYDVPGCVQSCRRFARFCLLAIALLIWSRPAAAVILWSDLATTLVHETGDGSDILGGA